ncbi:MAG: hypothetical protein JRG96_11945 [Deltaproteobacteria bacterium]|nr:hypothetical protein [Deltaproteobacteria bacterium]MBW2418193.1 hypothetical protein [Deltaproteobacteria bacterium]
MKLSGWALVGGSDSDNLTVTHAGPFDETLTLFLGGEARQISGFDSANARIRAMGSGHSQGPALGSFAYDYGNPTCNVVSLEPLSSFSVSFSVNAPTAYVLNGDAGVLVYGQGLPNVTASNGLPGQYALIELRNSTDELIQCKAAGAASCGVTSHVWGQEETLAAGTYTLTGEADSVGQSYVSSTWCSLPHPPGTQTTAWEHPVDKAAGFNFEFEVLCEGGGSSCFQVLGEPTGVPTSHTRTVAALTILLAATGLVATLSRRCVAP